MIPNVERRGDSSFFIYSGRMYKITKVFRNCSSKKNISDVNDYLASKNGEEGVIWSSKGDNYIIICRNDDLGKPYIPIQRGKKK